MKTYVLILSKVFPAYHNRKGEETNFRAAFNAGQPFKKEADTFCEFPKLHTMRGDYEKWVKRFEEIEKGKAQLSIRQWSGKPYHSKQVIIANLTKDDGIGLQKLTVIGCATIHPKYVDGISVSCKTLAHNDGLSEVDWTNWFERYDLTEPLAVIHFTKFRYKYEK